MTSKAAVDDFLEQKDLALVGVSRGGKKFGNAALRELTANGYRVFPVHPEAETVQGVRCYPNLRELPELVGGLLIVVPPDQTEVVVREAAAAGIRRVWMQLGSSSPNAIQFCAENRIEAVHGECILMFLRRGPALHRFHHWLWGLLGKLPR
jgi:predicted CoA-binding protein